MKCSMPQTPCLIFFFKGHFPKSDESHETDIKNWSSTNCRLEILFFFFWLCEFNEHLFSHTQTKKRKKKKKRCTSIKFSESNKKLMGKDFYFFFGL